MRDWTHVDPKGQARMVNVSSKRVTKREAWAGGRVLVKAETLKKIEENSLTKGDVLSVAKISAIMAVKKTSDLIPMCHPLQITGVDLSFSLAKDPPRVDILAKVQASDRTGVEMEALTAVAAAALTIYDMCKAIDRGILITEIGLIKKSGGKSGVYLRRDFSSAKKLVKR
ncbi:MAG: cyclic pyranopterin monophosphate synthase MoaC [Pseudomonadota bacterium]